MPSTQPDNLPHAEIIREELLQALAGNLRISLLHGAQEALLGGQHGAAAVDINAAAFEHHAAWLAIDFDFRLPCADPQPVSDLS